MIGRRGFITGLISLVAAPAIVRAGSLMPVKMMPAELFDPAALLNQWADLQVQRLDWKQQWEETAWLLFPDGKVIHGVDLHL